MELELVKKEEMLREEGIKMRKLTRESNIVKNRYQEYLEANIELRQGIESLEMMRYSEDEERYRGDREVPELKKKLMLSEQQVRSLKQLLLDQKNTYEAIMGTPENKLIWSIKRNLDLETQ